MTSDAIPTDVSLEARPAAAAAWDAAMEEDSPELYANREFSWLDFNERVLAEADDERNPLLERVRFLAITSSNLDEFYSKRIAWLKQAMRSSPNHRTVDGLTLAEQHAELQRRCAAMRRAIEARWRDTLERLVPGGLEGAEQRREIVQTLCLAVGLDASPDFMEVLAAAAVLMDVGRCVDYYNRERHTEWLLLEHGLDGWSHRDLALICALVRQEHQEKYTPTTYRPLVHPRDHEVISAGGALLALGDAIAARRPTGHSAPLAWRREGDELRISDALLGGWEANGLVARFKRAFGLGLVFEG